MLNSYKNLQNLKKLSKTILVGCDWAIVGKACNLNHEVCNNK